MASVAWSAAALGAAHPTLRAASRIGGVPSVTYGKGLKLSGHESLGHSQSVVLQSQEWPFKSPYATVGTVKATTSGNYTFTVTPTHATHFRVVVGTQDSGVVTLYVDEAVVNSTCNLCNTKNKLGAHTLVVTQKQVAPPGKLAVTGPVYFYYGQTDGSNTLPTTLSRVKTVSLHKSGSTLSFTVSYGVTFPKTAFEFAYATCYKNAESKDGLGLPGNHHCGDKSVKRGEVLG